MSDAPPSPPPTETEGAGFEVVTHAMGKTVGQCIDHGWQVRVACANGHGGGWRAAELELRFSRGASLDAIARRLRCARCGAREGRLTILNDAGETQRRAIAQYEAKRS